MQRQPSAARVHVRVEQSAAAEQFLETGVAHGRAGAGTAAMYSPGDGTLCCLRLLVHRQSRLEVRQYQTGPRVGAAGCLEDSHAPSAMAFGGLQNGASERETGLLSRADRAELSLINDAIEDAQEPAAEIQPAVASSAQPRARSCPLDALLVQRTEEQTSLGVLGLAACAQQCGPAVH